MHEAKKYVKYFLILTVVAIAFGLLSYLGAINEARNISLASIAIASFVRFYGWGVLLPVIFWFFRKFNFNSGEKFLSRLLIHSGFAIIISVIHFTIYSYFIWQIDASFRARYPEILTYLTTALAGSLYLGLTFYALIGFAYQEYLSRINYLNEEKRSSLLQSELARTQLQALKMQLQPHFLFNTLNSISSLTLTDPPKAHTMIAQLGDFLRLTLDYSEDQIVLLKEEIRFIKAYLEIEQTRFADRLTIKFEIEDDVLNALVPHLILQPIVENSIKHGISKIRTNGIIIIKAEKIDNKLILQVKDNGPAENLNFSHHETDDNTRTGLRNVQKRLGQIYGGEGVLEIGRDAQNQTTAAIKMPLNLESN